MPKGIEEVVALHHAERGEGKPLLLLHGFAGGGANWSLVFPEAPAGYRLIAPDLRGHGRSTNPSGEFTFRQCAADVFALLDRLGMERCQAIGASGGAQVLLHMATAQPARLEAMVLVSTAPYFPPEARAMMALMTVESLSEDELAVLRLTHTQGDEQIRALWRIGNGFKDSYDDVNFTPPLLSTIRARTLIVHGDRDPLYPLHIPVGLSAAIPGSHLWILPNAGHTPIFVGELRDQFARTALDFLRG